MVDRFHQILYIKCTIINSTVGMPERRWNEGKETA